MGVPWLVLVGGFLGAGKTTLILRAAKFLQSRGMRAAAIMNDQDKDLVDTRLARASQIDTREVTGGCFCCRFSDLLEAADELRAYQPDVIFAEPVGSCIDLSATILQPLKAYHDSRYRVAPLTVLIDPEMVERIPDGDMHYLLHNQIAEADILCLTKSDLYPSHRTFPFPVDFSVSAKTGASVEAWMTEVVSGRRIAGSQLLQLDYSRYAGAEAALGWLNVHADVTLNSATTPAMLVGPLLENIERALTVDRICIAHLKVFDRARSGFVKASICANNSAPQADGDLTADPGLRHELAINLRAIADPERLSRVVMSLLGELDGLVDVRHLSSFRPAPPKPEHRFSAVV